MQKEQNPSEGIALSRILMVVIAASVLEFCLGTFYAWSIFKAPLTQLYKWDPTQVQWPMTLNAIMTGLSAFLIGSRADRSPRAVALASGIFWGLGLIGAGYAVQHGNLTLLNWTFGIIGGIGVGMGYITGIAVPLKWMPHRRGLISGIVILSFGAGGMVVAKLGPGWIKHFGDNGPAYFLFGMGIIFTVLCLASGILLINPPGYKPKAAPASLKNLLPTEVLSSGRFWAIWTMVFITVYAGFAVLSQAAPMATKLIGLSDTQAGLLLMFLLLSNGLGRLFWSSLSDKFGPRPILVFIFASLVVVFMSLLHLKNPYLFGFACCYVGLCYGGIFGTMPAFTAGIFGVGQMGRFYGPVLTAISAGALFVQYYFTGLLKTQGYALPFNLIAGSLVVAALLPFLVSRKPEIEASAVIPQPVPIPAESGKSC
jgi:OFA family oxalate/formate antiporter-like MFS transporter